MGGRILVVEDNEQSLQLTSFLLEAFGHLAVEARSGSEALERARRQRIDLVLVGVLMHEHDRVDTLAELRMLPELASTPIVGLTTHETVGDRELGSAAGFDGYVTKPITPEGFAAQVDEFLPDGRQSSVGTWRARGTGTTSP